MTASFARAVARRFQTGIDSAGLTGLADGELLDRFVRARDEHAFAVLVQRHERLVRSACRRVLANPDARDDAFQATFVVLVRRAASVAAGSGLGGWLYGVAHRIAVRARWAEYRRQLREKQAASRRPEARQEDLSWREAVEVLHAELDALPDQYRLPLLLCYLEGHSREEAAESLGVTPAAVKGRLERGRQLLADRLGRRGVTLCAGLLAALVGGPLEARSAGSGLVGLTVRAASGAVRPGVAAMLKGGSGMSVLGLKAVVALVAAVGLVAVGYAGLGPPPNGDGPPPGRPAVADTKPAVPAKAEMRVRGRASGADGAPLAGARLSIIASGQVTDAGATGPDGRFVVAAPQTAAGGYLIVRADAAGFDFAELDLRAEQSVELRAVKDNVIRGRVVDTEGRPVAGARVAAADIRDPGRAADGFLSEWVKRVNPAGVPPGERQFWGGVERAFVATADAEGRFTLAGLGAERLVSLRCSGPGLASCAAVVLNRNGFNPESINEATRKRRPAPVSGPNPLVLHGPDLSLVLEPDKPVRGRLTDVDTGMPRPGVKIMLRADPSEALPVPLAATTGADGRYEIRGARKARSYTVGVGDEPRDGFAAAAASAADTAGYEPVTINVRAKRGVVIRGRVIDRATGKPLPGFAMVDTLADNPYPKDVPEFGSAERRSVHATSADGGFRVVTPPGPVLLMGGPDYRRLPGGFGEYAKYRPAAPDPKYPRYFTGPGPAALGLPTDRYYGSDRLVLPIEGSACKVLDIKPGIDSVEQDLLVEAGPVAAVTLRDGKGGRVGGVWVSGATGVSYNPHWCEGDQCGVYNLGAGQPRTVVFYEPGRKLAGAVVLERTARDRIELTPGAAPAPIPFPALMPRHKPLPFAVARGDAKEPLAVTLEPLGAVQGRLVDEHGKPLARVEVGVTYESLEAGRLHESVIHKSTIVTSDADGCFELTGLLPRCTFALRCVRGRQGYQEVGAVAGGLSRQANPAETGKLGAVLLAPAPEQKRD